MMMPGGLTGALPPLSGLGRSPRHSGDGGGMASVPFGARPPVLPHAVAGWGQGGKAYQRLSEGGGGVGD